MNVTNTNSDITVSAIITRADGSIEDLGIISSSSDGNIMIQDETMLQKFMKKIRGGN